MLDKEAFDQLYEIALGQEGCFTASQARIAGYSTQSQHYHVGNRDWIRLSRGIFRLRHFPHPSRVDLMTVYLWAMSREGEPQGVFSHETAFSLLPFSVWTPIGMDLTVPRAFHRTSVPPAKLRLYRGAVIPTDITMIAGVRVTKPLRTVVDLLVAGFVQRYHLFDYLRAALESGVLAHEEMVRRRLDENERRLLADALAEIGYDRAGEIRNGQTLPRGARRAAG